MPGDTPPLTLFALPKPFVGHIGVIQSNAVASWRRAGFPVILMGRDAGVREAAERYGTDYIPDVRCNEFGTPLLDSAFALAEQHARTPMLGYVNGDILLMSDLARVMRRVTLPRFLAVGRRTDLDVTQPIDFQTADWEDRLRDRVGREGKVQDDWHIDYFLFRRGSGLAQLPPFAVGRPRWDNWMIANALEKRVPVVSLTAAVLAVHQNHGYGHVPQQRGGMWHGPEADRNSELMQGKEASIGRYTHRALADGRVIHDRDKLSREAFELGYAERFTRRGLALRQYLRAFSIQPRGKYLLAIPKLLAPGPRGR